MRFALNTLQPPQTATLYRTNRQIMAIDKHPEIASVIASLIEAWANQDAEAYGSHFTAGATYVTYIGTFYSGREDIVKSHRALFSTFLKGTRLADEIKDIRLFGADTAVVISRGDTYKGKHPKKLTKVQTYTLIRENDGRWRIAAFHNTKCKPLMEAMTFRFAPETAPSGGAV